MSKNIEYSNKNIEKISKIKNQKKLNISDLDNTEEENSKEDNYYSISDKNINKENPIKSSFFIKSNNTSLISDIFKKNKKETNSSVYNNKEEILKLSS